MNSPVTSTDFGATTPGQPLCDVFGIKLLNNEKHASFLSWLLTDAGLLNSGFISELLRFLPPIGKHVRFSPVEDSDTNPENGAVWVEANGQLLARSDYARLFAAIGTGFNLPEDSDETKFRVPDISGRFVIARNANYGVGSNGGEEDNKITLEEVNLPAHNHIFGCEKAGMGVATAPGTFHSTGTNRFEQAEETAAGAATRNTGGGQPVTVLKPPYFTCIAYILAGYKVGGAMV